MQNDRTQLLGTDDYPLDPHAAAAAEPCPGCSSTIPPGEQFCPKCGYQRGTWAQDDGASAPQREPSPFVLVADSGQEHALPLGEAVFGRGEVDIAVADGYLSRRHLLLTTTADSVSVQDLGSANGTFYGERRLSPDETIALSDGETLKMGQALYTLRRIELAAPPEPEPEAAEAATAEVDAMGDADNDAPGLAPIGELVETHVELAPATSPWALARPGEEPEYFLAFGESILGRKPEKATVVVRGDGYISGAHLRLISSETTLEATDLGSTNGSFVNGEQLAPDVMRQLGAGDMLRLGQTELVVVYNEIGEAISIGEEVTAPTED